MIPRTSWSRSLIIESLNITLDPYTLSQQILRSSIRPLMVQTPVRDIIYYTFYKRV